MSLRNSLDSAVKANSQAVTILLTALAFSDSVTGQQRELWKMKQLKFNSSHVLTVSSTGLVMNSTSTEDEHCSSLEDDNPKIKALKILVYGLVLIISLFGNAVIITTVVRNKHLRTTVNFLIANMAASDLLISACAVPVKLSEIVEGPRRWLIDGIVGLILCKLVYFFQDISMAVSIQSLLVIGIDRYRAIVYPFRPPIVTLRRCRIIISAVWLTSMGLHGIYFYLFRLVSNNDETFCTVIWAPSFHPRKAQEHYIIVVFTLLVILPITVLTLVYSRIIWSLRHQNVKNGKSLLQIKKQKENSKVIKNISAIMIAFAFCILPIFVYGILCVFVWKWKMPCNMDQFGFAAHFVLFSNAAITPIIYFVFNERYRKGLKDVLKQLQFRRRDTHEEFELTDNQ